MQPWLRRIQAWWRSVFFWQTPRGSEEFTPETHHDHALVLDVIEQKSLPGWKQLRFVNRILNAQEKRIFWTAIAVAVLGGFLGAADLAYPHFTKVPIAGGTITEGVIGSPKLINPLFASTNDVDRDLTALVYSGLFRVDADLIARPDLAESYSWSEDAKTLEVRLRKDARFHDGEPVTAEDVVFTYQSVRNPSWHSPLSGSYRHIKVVKVDDETVQFQLDTLSPHIFMDLTLGILPAHIWGTISGQNATLADANQRPIGSGPYQVQSFTRDSRGAILTYQLQRFPLYYGLKPNIETWKFRFYGDRVQAQNALEGGQIDALAFVPWASAEELKRGHVQTATIELPQETIAFFNTDDALLKETKIRQALSLAVDRTELQETIGQHASVITSPFPFLATSTTESDLEQARTLLDGLGWKLAQDETVRKKPSTSQKSDTTENATSTTGDELTLNVDVPNQADLIQVAEFLKRRWSLIGARVTVHINEPELFLRDATSKRDYQILIWNVLLPPNQDIASFWKSDQAREYGLNLSNLSDRSVDQALDAVNLATSTAALETARTQVSNTILKSTPALFLLRPAYAYLVSNAIQGVTDARVSRPSDRLLHAMNWYIKTGWRWR